MANLANLSKGWAVLGKQERVVLTAWQEWRDRIRVKKMGYQPQQWKAAVADWSALDRYGVQEKQALMALTFRFLARKSIVPGGGFEISDAMRLKVATMACLPILELGLNWYDGWYTVILYERDFIPNRPHITADGVVHETGPVLSGEAWHQGPVILSWGAVCDAGEGSNVVIHEMSHKLDMRYQGANGAPPLHQGMSPQQWHDTFSQAFHTLQEAHQRHQRIPLDVYALTGPGEFFAVCSEAFFEAPDALYRDLPDLYNLLARFYRQGEKGV